MSGNSVSEPFESTPNRPMWKRVRRGAVLFCVTPYLCIIIMLGSFQRSLIYHPKRETTIGPEDADMPAGCVHTVTFKSHDGLKLRGWHLLPDGRPAHTLDECNEQLAARWLVIYFHGNAGNRKYRIRDCRDFSRLDANVFLFDYRGYGDNPGSPSEADLSADARAVWKYATEERRVPPNRILIYGESLGGGVATRLASEMQQAGTPPAALILNSTFSSLTDAAAWHYPWIPVRWLLIDRYPSINHIKSVHCPIVQIHGTADTIVPINLAHNLFEAAPTESANGIEKQFIELAGAGHNDIPVAVFDKALRDLVQRIEVEALKLP